MSHINCITTNWIHWVFYINYVSVGRGTFKDRSRSGSQGKGLNGTHGSDDENSGIIELSPEHGFLDYTNDDDSTCQDKKPSKSGEFLDQYEKI